MRFASVVALILLTSCLHVKNTNKPDDTTVSRSDDYQQEIDQLLSADADNKRWEEIYLEEIAVAQDNDDHDAYKFFIIEYIKVPRLTIPKWMESEPGFVPRKSAKDILHGKFMRQAGIKIIIKPNTSD